MNHSWTPHPLTSNPMKNDSQFSAEIISDSIYNGSRLTTFSLVYPRFIHSEFMTHRVFSRNAASSRAIPVNKVIEQVINNPAKPIHWGKNQAGMQARTEHKAPVMLDDVEIDVESAWLMAALQAAEVAQAMADAGYHKQLVNRILEPFQLMKTIVSATDYDNFFALRTHPDAQPEIQHLAKLMQYRYENQRPRVLVEGEWHLPYATEIFLPHAKCQSVARCARVSYLNHEGRESSLEEDLKLYERLVLAKPPHLSPTEHQAMAGTIEGKNGNFNKNWVQLRHLLTGEGYEQETSRSI